MSWQLSVWRSRLASMGWGAAGILLVLLLFHLWTDHVAFHQIVDMINAANAAKQTAPTK